MITYIPTLEMSGSRFLDINMQWARKIFNQLGNTASHPSEGVDIRNRLAIVAGFCVPGEVTKIPGISTSNSIENQGLINLQASIAERAYRIQLQHLKDRFPGEVTGNIGVLCSTLEDLADKLNADLQTGGITQQILDTLVNPFDEHNFTDDQRDILKGTSLDLDLVNDIGIKIMTPH